MGREVRRVPKDWIHPEGKALYGRSFAADIAEWEEEHEQWGKGFRRSYSSRGFKFILKQKEEQEYTFEEWTGERPCEDDYMPDWPEAERTHYQMYETTSDGTPISPVMDTPEALAQWLVDHNASAFAGQTANYEGWLRVAKGGYACSALMKRSGEMISGVDGLTE